jgi:hypothetical protein
MVVGNDGRESTIRNALSQPEQFGVTPSAAKIIQEEIMETIEVNWDEASDYAGITRNESKILRQATILSPACFY